MKNNFIKCRLISPLFIGGSTGAQLDSTTTIRPPSISGHLHFWARALAGGKFDTGQHLTSKEIKEIQQIEHKLFGNTDTGQKLLLFPPKISSVNIDKLYILPHRNYKVNEAVLEGNIVFYFNTERINPNDLILLKTVFWTWLNLGGIGKRSRRGLGSLEWIPSEGDFLDGLFKLPPMNFKTIAEIEKYLCESLDTIGEIWDIDFNKEREIHSFFCLASKAQVFVGNIIKKSNGEVIDEVNGEHDGIIHLLHGISNNATGEEIEMGHTESGRQASPMLWRVHRVGGGYAAVLTWSPLQNKVIKKGSDIYNYLTERLGFTKPVSGKEIWLE